MHRLRYIHFLNYTVTLKLGLGVTQGHRKPQYSVEHIRLYTGWPKKLAPFFLYALTLPNINRFSKLFHCRNLEKICNNTVVKDPTTPQMCRYTTL